MSEPDSGVTSTATSKPRNMRVMAIYASAIVTGIVIGCIMIVMRLGEPDQPTLSGPIEPGQEKVIPIAWPIVTGVNRAQTVFVDLAIAERVADEIAITIEMIDPESPDKRFQLTHVEKPQGVVENKLIRAEYDFNLDPQLVTLRGNVRQIKATMVDLIVRVERLSGTKMGYVYVMNAGAVRPLRPDDAEKVLGSSTPQH